MSRISTRAANTILLNQNMQTQRRLFDAQISMTSEKKSQVYQGIAVDSRRLVNLENTTSLLQRFNMNNEQMDVKLNIMNTSVEAIRESFTQFRDYLGDFASTSKKEAVDVKDIQDQAFRTLKAIEGYLNIDVDGQYLFSGNKVLTEPIDFGLSTLDSFQSKFNGDTVSTATTRAAALENFSYNQDTLNSDTISIDASNFLKFRQDSADELTKLINSLTVAAATGSINTISSETTKQPRTGIVAADVVTAAASVAEVETITLSGDYISGDVISIRINNFSADKYTVVAGDIGANQTATLSNIATSLAAAVDGGTASGAIGSSSTGAVITITADAVNATFVTQISASNDASVIESIGTASGGQTGSSLLTSASTFAATSGDMLTFEVLANGTSQSTASFTVTATSTIDDMLSAITNLNTDITATFNVNSGEIEIQASGGLEFQVTEASPFTVAQTATQSAAGAEVETLTLAGDYIAGDIISVGVNTGLNADTYTVQASDIGANQTATLASVATNLAAAITAGTSNTDGNVSATATAGVITLTANTVASAFATTVNTLGADYALTQTGSAGGVEIETVSLSGSYSAGDQISIALDKDEDGGAVTTSYTVIAADLLGNNTANLNTIATNIAAAVNAVGANGSSEEVTASVSSNIITFTGDSAGVFSTVATTTDNSAGAALTEFQFGSGAGLLTSGVSQTFEITGGSTDLITEAFNASPSDTLTLTVTGGDGVTNSTIFSIGTKSVAALVTQLNDTDADVTASFNTTTNQIDIKSAIGGAVLTFADTGAALSALTFNDGTNIVTNGDAVTYASTQTDTDTLIAAYGTTATDVLTMSLGTGATTNFTIGNQTIAELVSRIGGLDSSITASFNTTSKQIDITSDIAGTAVAFTNTTGDPLSELRFNDGEILASGESSTFTVDGLTKSSTITATSALFANLSVGSSFVVENSASNNGTYQVSEVSDDGRTVTVNTRMLTDEANVTPVITYRDPSDNNKTITLSSNDFTDLSFSRSTDTINATATGSLSGIPVGTSFTVAGTANNDGTYTVVSNDGSDVVIESLKLSDEGLTTGSTFFDLQSNTDVNFDAATKTIEIRQSATSTPVPNSFNGLIVGQPITLSGTVSNSGLYTVASISSDGSSITVNETLFDETDSDGVGINSTRNDDFSYTTDTQLVFDATNETIQLTNNATTAIPNAFNGLSVGMKFTVSDMPTNENNRTYTVASVSADGSTITVSENIDISETDTNGARIRSYAASGSISSDAYYSGDEQFSTHRVSSTQSFSRNIDGIDPAFEKGIRALQLIAQGAYGTAGGLDNNHNRVDEALFLVNSALQRAVSGTPPFGEEIAGNIEQVEIDIGYHRVLMQTTTEINLNTMAFFDGAVADIENVDMQAIVTQMLDDQNALEASYQAYARISQLSLTKYL